MSSDFEDLDGRIRGLLITMSNSLSPEETAEVAELLEHAELGEALRALAWILVEESKIADLAIIDGISELAERMGITDELPPGLFFQAVRAPDSGS